MMLSLIFAAVVTVCSAANQPPALKLENDSLRISFNPKTALFDIFDKRANRSWQMLAEKALPFSSVERAVTSPDGRGLSFVARPRGEAFALSGEMRLEGNEITCCLDAPAATPLARGWLDWPLAFTAQKGERLLLPHGPGYAFPCELLDLGKNFPNALRVYCRDCNMGVWAHYAEGGAGYVTIIETPSDAAVNFAVRMNGLRQLNMRWMAARGTFGYARRVRFVFEPSCGPVVAARHYRKVLQKRGWLKTLSDKKRDMPRLAAAIDDLAGAPDVWYWTLDGNKPAFARTLKAMGFQNFLFCFATRKDLGVWRTAEDVAEIAKMDGVLPCEYDVYTDTMESRYLPRIEYVRPYWSVEAADAGDIVFDATGKPRRGWRVAFKGEKDGSTNSIGCAHICEQCAPKYLLKRLNVEMRKFPGYRARFLDVTGTSVGECYNPAHPHGRRESSVYRAEIFKTVQEVFGLVCGTEENIEPYVSSTCYGEGVMTAPRHRVDGGRFMWKIYDDIPPAVVQGMDPALRVPFWELVWHGCTVSYWYWTDYNNKFTKLWRRKDLINALYGTPPMYFFDEHSFARQRGELMASWRRAVPVARETAFCAMTDFRILSDDRLVQQTTFANGVRVTVNFATAPRTLADGTILAAEDLRIEHLK